MTIMIILLIMLTLCAARIETRWEFVPFDYVGSFELDDDYRDVNGVPYSSSLRWYSLSEKPYSERGPDIQMLNCFDFDYNSNTYIICLGYNLYRFEYKESLFSKQWKNYHLRQGYAHLGIECAANVVNVYRIKKMWVEPAWNSSDPNKDSVVIFPRR